MQYSQILVKFLDHLVEVQGAYGKRLQIVPIETVVQAIGEGDETVTGRLVHLAFKDLRESGLVSARRVLASDLSGEHPKYMELDITGKGLQFIESIRQQAKAEGKSKSWLWSMVEKAATLAQLVSLALQAAGKA